MKRTLLEMVQSILSDMDSEAVNSISDSVEAQQIASVIEDTYYNMIAAREIPEHKGLIKLTSLSDNTKPTHFKYPDRVKKLERVAYNTEVTVGRINYQEIFYVEPIDFLTRSHDDSDAVQQVADVNAGTTLLIRNDRMPRYYTSFDDLHIVMDAYDATTESILQESKTQAFGTTYPTFNLVDSFEPDIDDTMLPYLLAESKSVCFSVFKSGIDAKIEQASKRLKSYVQNDMYRTKQENKRNKYGRYGPAGGVRHG